MKTCRFHLLDRRGVARQHLSTHKDGALRTRVISSGMAVPAVRHTYLLAQLRSASLWIQAYRRFVPLLPTILVVQLLLQASPSAAGSWRHQFTSGLRYQDLHLKTEDPISPPTDRLASADASYRLVHDTIPRWQNHEFTANYGESLRTDATYRGLSSRHTLGFRTRHQTHTWSLGLQRTTGQDPLNQPIEQSVGADSSPFTSLILGYIVRQELNARHSLGWEVTLSRNQQNRSQIETADAQISWVYRPTKLWTTTLLQRLATQTSAGARTSLQYEIAQYHLWALSSRLSVDGSLGYTGRQESGATTDALLLLAALNYSTRALFLRDEETGFRVPSPLEQPEGAAPSSQADASFIRLGCSRARDQRRQGDAFFIADRCFVTGLQALAPQQTLRLNLARTVSEDVRISNERAFFREQAIELAYRFDHSWSEGTWRAAFEAEIQAQQASFADTTSERQIYSLGYSVLL